MLEQTWKLFIAMRITQIPKLSNPDSRLLRNSFHAAGQGKGAADDGADVGPVQSTRITLTRSFDSSC